ncbi:MAG TPA: hypothetical protein PKG95_09015, partial [Anaerolineaceae bacterium]|nr:hypothetical protein [Anaerolineaceae bacterium]
EPNVNLSWMDLSRFRRTVAQTKNMRQPDGCDPTPTQALVQSVVAQLIVNDARQAQPLHHFQQQRKVVNSFCGNVHLRVHSLSLSGNS